VTAHDPAPEGPRPRQPGDPQVPAPRLSPEDLRELREPHDFLIPDPYCDFDPPHLPPNAILISQLNGWQPDAPPSLAELLESIRTREPEPEPEPDWEAEP
jgi:hypothetical protein